MQLNKLITDNCIGDLACKFFPAETEEKSIDDFYKKITLGEALYLFKFVYTNDSTLPYTTFSYSDYVIKIPNIVCLLYKSILGDDFDNEILGYFINKALSIKHAKWLSNYVM